MWPDEGQGRPSAAGAVAYSGAKTCPEPQRCLFVSAARAGGWSVVTTMVTPPEAVPVALVAVLVPFRLLVVCPGAPGRSVVADGLYVVVSADGPVVCACDTFDRLPLPAGNVLALPAAVG